MIIASYLKDGLKQTEINATNQNLLHESLWIDLINPSEEEENTVEQYVRLNIPTREEMREIELSSRLYKENDTLFMTATMIAQSDSINPKQDAVTFVITPKQLITIRYIEPQSFKLFASRINKMRIDNSISLLTELLDTTVDRLADILERISHLLESYSKDIFQPQNSHNTNYQEFLQQLGANGELNAKIVESLVSFNRLIPFFDQSAIVKIDDHIRLLTLSKDISSLNDHATFLSNKISFLLEATLGMVQIEQNAIIKIFSVAAVIFLPPTLIASIYGMNFSFMPELSWKYGYVLAISLMLFSSWAPYKYFKYRKWL
ncbi:magnesium transporter CorA family protein [Legionella maioricensis]|uniref:Magnesium transport protein CorA n=1 Tax=Legionella maioricensis TaxID=2896528 RepID=A0A9X2D1D6_9GAMM|nr:magnesium transporter CorA family protein [Legionella maioricensis]MCL9684835.1 magnesium transporter CorA family protein [Legionella maioricensis]MCL9688515.1 magnesium transporter CorA family protein [Legionella maioricensis]